jgi:hypothetical protein
MRRLRRIGRCRSVCLASEKVQFIENNISLIEFAREKVAQFDAAKSHAETLGGRSQIVIKPKLGATQEVPGVSGSRAVAIEIRLIAHDSRSLKPAGFDREDNAPAIRVVPALGRPAPHKGNTSGAVSFDATWTFFINLTDQTSGGSRP